MKTIVCFLCLCGTALSAELSSRELHRLAAYSAYLVSVSSEIGGGTPTKPDTPDNRPSGGVCGECNGVGKVGDGVVMFTCGACGGTGKASSATSPQPEPEVFPEEIPQEPQQPPEPEPDITQLRQSNWNWTGKNNPPDSVMRKHLMDEHDVDPSSANKMSRQEMIAMHNLLHNSEVRAAAPKSSKSNSSSSCPSGNCPTSSSSSSSSRYRLFRRR